MEDVRIILSASWMALMLTYLLGDVFEFTQATSSLAK